MKSYKSIYEIFKRMEVAKKSTKLSILLKLQLGHMPTVPVMAGKKREENPPFPPTLRQDVLASSRKIMLAI